MFVCLIISSAGMKSNPFVCCKKVLANTLKAFPAARHYVMHLYYELFRSPAQVRADFVHILS